MFNDKMHVYSIVLKYSLRKKSEGQRSHPKYRENLQSYIVRCGSKEEAVLIAEQVFFNTHKAQYNLTVSYVIEI